MKINDTDYQVKYNLRSMFVFEQITEKPFKVTTLFDEYILLYSCIISVEGNPSLDFDSFIDYCNDHQEVMGEFLAILEEDNKMKNLLDDKKKVKEKS